MSPCNLDDELEALVYAELSAKRAEQLEQHAARCHDCAALVSGWRAERAFMWARARRQPAPPAGLWASIEAHLAADAAGAGKPTVWRFAPRLGRMRAVGLPVAAAAAAVLFVFLLHRSSQEAVDSVPSPDSLPASLAENLANRLAEARAAVDRAEIAYREAFATLGMAYRRERARLGPLRVTHYDEEFQATRARLQELQAQAGVDLHARRRLLAAYSRQLHALQSVLFDMEEAGQ